MEAKTVTTINRLFIGDRFYKLSDAKKIVYERVKSDLKKTKYRTYGFWAKSDTSNEVKVFDGKTRVMFLRTNEPV